MVRPVIFVPYFLHTHCATGQSDTFITSFDNNQFHLQQHLHQNACIAIPHFTNNFPIIFIYLYILASFEAGTPSFVTDPPLPISIS
jgi:T-box transcription factor 2/3, repressor domain